MTLRVRYAETDSMGIAHHSSYVVYLEEARSEYARQRGMPYSDFEAAGFFLAVTEVNIRYIKSAVYEQQITIYVWIDELKSRGMTFNYEIVDTQTGELLVTARTRHICITRDGKVARIPGEIRQKWLR